MDSKPHEHALQISHIGGRKYCAIYGDQIQTVFLPLRIWDSEAAHDEACRHAIESISRRIVARHDRESVLAGAREAERVRKSDRQRKRKKYESRFEVKEELYIRGTFDSYRVGTKPAPTWRSQKKAKAV